MNIKIYGLERRIDDLGRIVIPKEFRIPLGIKENDVMEICVVNDIIIIRKVGSDTE
jgi:AbrB family looped-hinge helix DNA binding protein